MPAGLLPVTQPHTRSGCASASLVKWRARDNAEEIPMLQKDITVGGRYTAIVSGKMTTVRVESVREVRPFQKGGKTTTRYDCLNERTGKKCVFKSAAKFRKVATSDPVTKPVVKPKLLSNLTGTVKRGTPAAAKKFPEGEQCLPPTSGGSGTTPSTSGSASSGKAPTHDTTGRPASPVSGQKSKTASVPAPSANASDNDTEGEDSPPFATLRHGIPPYPNAGRAAASTDSDGTGTAKDAPAKPANGSGVKGAIATLLAKRTTPVEAVPTERGTVAGYTPTAEQSAILDAVHQIGNGKVLVIGAGAGSGKTATLRMLEEILPGKGQYTAFNKSLVADSKSKFRKAAVNTTHSLAFQAVGRRYSHRLGGQRVRSEQVARMLGLESMSVTVPDPEGKLNDDGSPAFKVKTLSAGFLSTLVRKAIDKFCQSADEKVSRNHFKRIEGIDGVDLDTGRREHRNNDLVVNALLPFAQAAWKDIANPDGQLPFTHDHYVKVWGLGRGQDSPVIYCDYLLLDEAQDSAPVFLDIVQRQSALIILVGDENQTIYEWRGSVDAMKAFPGAPRRLLSQSFRFGQSIADVANSILGELDVPTDLVMKGLHSIPSRVVGLGKRLDDDDDFGCDRSGEPHENVIPDAILCRTNACAVGFVLSAFAEGKRPHLIGGGADVVAFVRAAQELQDGKRTQHQELYCFESWVEVQEYTKAEGGEGDDIKLLVKLVDEFKCRPILEALERMPEEKDADLVVCTAHKSKGREWGNVRLAPDFPPANKMSDPDRRLLYVAATRAKYILDVGGCPPFIPGRDKETGEIIDPIVVEFTAKMPTKEELESWLVERATEDVTEKPAPQPEYKSPSLRDSEGAEDGPPQPTFTWASNGGDWAVKGPAGWLGQRVTVTRKNGTSSIEYLAEVAKTFPEATLYRTRGR